MNDPSIITREVILTDLLKLGIKKNDILFITVDLFSVGLFYKNKKETLRIWSEILYDIAGEEGCVIVASYTETFFRFKKNKSIVFNRFSKTDVGPLANYLIEDPRSSRSKHPTNSCIGIGPAASEILSQHDEKSLSYSVLGTIMNRGGKFLMIGTMDNKNAPQAMHFAQEVLGYTSQSPYRDLYQTYYQAENGNIKLFTRRDLGGCTRGAHKLYGSLIINDAIRFGYIGNAFSAVMEGKKSFDVIYNELKSNRRLILCGDKSCTECYGNFRTNGLRIIPHYISKLYKIIRT